MTTFSGIPHPTNSDMACDYNSDMKAFSQDKIWHYTIVSASNTKYL